MVVFSYPYFSNVSQGAFEHFQSDSDHLVLDGQIYHLRNNFNTKSLLLKWVNITLKDELEPFQKQFPRVPVNTLNPIVNAQTIPIQHESLVLFENLPDSALNFWNYTSSIGFQSLLFYPFFVTLPNYIFKHPTYENRWFFPTNIFIFLVMVVCMQNLISKILSKNKMNKNLIIKT